MNKLSCCTTSVACHITNRLKLPPTMETCVGHLWIVPHKYDTIQSSYQQPATLRVYLCVCMCVSYTKLLILIRLSDWQNSYLIIIPQCDHNKINTHTRGLLWYLSVSVCVVWCVPQKRETVNNNGNYKLAHRCIALSAKRGPNQSQTI